MNKKATRALTSRIRKNICPTSRRSQMKLSFSMIFSIILIIIFLAFAFYVIMKFIDMQHLIQIETFQNNLQAHIKTIWDSPGEYSEEKEYYLPQKITEVCFIDDDYHNLMFVSKNPMDGANIKYLNIKEITSGGDYCIENVDGKVGMTLVKDYGETLIKITR